MSIAGVNLTWQMAVAAAALAQFAIVALAAIAAPVKMRKPLGVSTVLFAAAWMFAFNFKSFVGQKQDATQASVAGTIAPDT